MQDIYLQVPGKPLAKKTHRQCIKVNWEKNDLRRWPYFPQSKEATQVKKILQDQFKGDLIDTGLFVRFVFHMPVPKSWAKRQKNLALDGRLLPIGKPDVTNLAKFYEDCMNGIIYKDDAQIIWVSPIKKYDSEAYTEIYLTEFRPEIYQRFQGLAP